MLFLEIPGISQPACFVALARINEPFVPFLSNKFVGDIKAEWPVKFRAIKVDIKSVPERSKWVAILCIAAVAGCTAPSLEAEYCYSATQQDCTCVTFCNSAKRLNLFYLIKHFCVCVLCIFFPFPLSGLGIH